MESLRQMVSRLLTYVEDDLSDSLKWTWKKDTTDAEIDEICIQYAGEVGVQSKEMASLIRAARDLDAWMYDNFFEVEVSA